MKAVWQHFAPSSFLWLVANLVARNSSRLVTKRSFFSLLTNCIVCSSYQNQTFLYCRVKCFDVVFYVWIWHTGRDICWVRLLQLLKMLCLDPFHQQYAELKANSTLRVELQISIKKIFRRQKSVNYRKKKKQMWTAASERFFQKLRIKAGMVKSLITLDKIGGAAASHALVLRLYFSFSLICRVK